MSKLYTCHYRLTHPAEWVQTEEGDRVEGREGGMEGGREGGGSKEGRGLEVQCVYVGHVHCQEGEGAWHARSTCPRTSSSYNTYISQIDIIKKDLTRCSIYWIPSWESGHLTLSSPGVLPAAGGEYD